MQQPDRDSPTGTKRRRNRKKCVHCGEELSYSAYLQHRRLYYIASERRWMRQSDNATIGADRDNKRPRTDVPLLNTEMEETTESTTLDPLPDMSDNDNTDSEDIISTSQGMVSRRMCKQLQ